MKILVIDTETTDINGVAFGDVVVDIGIAEVDTSRKSVRPYFYSVVGHDVTKWDDRKRNAWVFQHTDLTTEEVCLAPPQEEVAQILRECIDTSLPITAFNIDFDFKRFLDFEPWCLGNLPKAPDIMLAADVLEDIPRSKYDHSTGWRAYPIAENTYNYLFGDRDPANIHGKEKHRAMSDAIVEGYILLELYERGLYKMPKVVF